MAVSPRSTNTARIDLGVVSSGQYSSRTGCDRACNLVNLASSPAQLRALCRLRQRQHHLQVPTRCPTPAQTSHLNLMMSLRLLDAHAPANLASLLQVSVGRREEWSLPWPSRTGSARPTRRFESRGSPRRSDCQAFISECGSHSQLAACRRENAAAAVGQRCVRPAASPFLGLCEGRSNYPN